MIWRMQSWTTTCAAAALCSFRSTKAPSSDVRAYLGQYPDSYLADRLRADWLKELGKRRDWPTFDLELAPLLVDDADIRCYTLASRLARQDDSVLTHPVH